MPDLHKFFNDLLKNVLLIDVRLFNSLVSNELRDRSSNPSAIARPTKQPALKDLSLVNDVGVTRLNIDELERFLKSTDDKTLSTLSSLGEEILKAQEEKAGLRPPSFYQIPPHMKGGENSDPHQAKPESNKPGSKL